MIDTIAIKYSKIETWFDVQDGIKYWHNLHEYKRQMVNLKDGRYYTLTERIENQQSREQNNARWAIPYMFFERALKETGNLPQTASKLDVHEWAMVNCLPSDYRERIYELWKSKPGTINIKTGEVYKEPFRLTTTKMSKKDSNNYYEAMQDCYAENFSSGEPSDLIPDPDPNYNKKRNKSK